MSWIGNLTGVNAEKEKRRDAQRERKWAEERAENEKKNKEKALKEKEEAEEQACNERRMRERALHEKTEAEERARNEREIRDKALKDKEHAEKMAENLCRQNEELLADKEKIDKERQDLFDEKEKKEKLEAEQKAFKWGPKKDKAWTEAEIERLKKVLYQPRKDSAGNDIRLNLLAFGPTGHGKSSFCNGCRTAILGDVEPSTYYSVANISRTLTSGFHGSKYGDHWIIDMAGIFESNRISSVHIEDIACGKVPFYAELTDTLEVKDKSSLKTLTPGENDVSCIIIVLKYDTELGQELRRQVEVILELGGKGVISYHLVLTRLDECDPEFNDTDNIPNLYKSAKVQGAVKRMSEETGIPPYAISFVRNYTNETESDIYSCILHLRVLERVIKSALDQVEKGLNKQRQKEKYFSETDQMKDTKQQPMQRKKEESPADKQQQKGVNDSITVRELMFMIIILLFAVLVVCLRS